MRGLTALQDGVCDALLYALKKDRDWAMSRIKDNRPGLKDRPVELVKKADSEAVQSLLTDVTRGLSGSKTRGTQSDT